MGRKTIRKKANRNLKCLYIIYSALLVLIIGCSEKKQNGITERARDYNNRAIKTYTHNLLNKDSLNQSLLLIDSAITDLPEYNEFYYNKIEILKRLGDLSQSLEVIDLVIQKDSLDYRGYFMKGELFSLLEKNDSSRIYFLRSLRAIEKSKILQSVPMFRDSKIIRIYFLLGDSIRYNKHLTLFKNKYRNWPEYEKYIDSIEE